MIAFEPVQPMIRYNCALVRLSNFGIAISEVSKLHLRDVGGVRWGPKRESETASTCVFEVFERMCVTSPGRNGNSENGQRAAESLNGPPNKR